MAIQRERLHRKNVTGEYDTIHLETQADIVVRPDGTTVEAALTSPQPINKGGTGKNNAANAIYNLISGCTVITDSSQIAAEDMFGIIDTSENTCKKISVDAIIHGSSSGGGGSETPGTENDWSLGGYVTWGGKQWIVVHVDAALFYLARTELEDPSAAPRQLQTRCNNYLSNFNGKELDNMVDVDTGLTHGKVFVASKDQMNGWFSYFNSDNRRSMNELYWTATQEYGDSLQEINNYFVSVDGRVVVDSHSTSISMSSYRVRYFICVNYNGVVEITE